MDLLNLFVKIGVKDEASEAVEGVSQNIIGKLGKAAATAAKALAGAFAVKKVVDFGKAAFDAYASFEQLQGGVAKLYGNANMELDEYIDSMKSSGKSVDELTKTYRRNEKAQELMMQQASEAWKTAGVDANTYMEQATSMSAALINSLGGDTVKAAEQTDVAMRAISDNVNTFGTDMASVSQAFMGFSKQNYTMLDNLKLGYGGTKTEMERLIADANEWGAANGKASNLSIDSFSDVVTAIEQIQEKQGIAGTTTKEAMTTIEGSMNATKAAWQNLVTEFGKPDADIGARIADMFTAVMGENGEGGLLRNVANEVRTIATNMIGAASDGIGIAASYIRDNGPKLLESAMLSVGDALGRAWDRLLDFRTDFNLVDAVFGEGGVMETAGKVGEWVRGIGQVIAENWPYIQDQLGMLWDEVVATAETFGPQIMEVAGRLVGMARDAIVEHGPEIAAKVGELIGEAVAGIGKFAVDMSNKGRELVMGIITGSSEEGKNLRKWFADFFPDGLLNGLGDFATFLVDVGKSLLNGLLDGIGEVAPDVEQAIRGAFDKVLEFFEGVGEFIKDPVGSIKDGLGELIGSFDDASDKTESDMGRVEGSVDKSMTSASKSIGKYNNVKLKDKRATATVTGNAQDGKAKSSIEDTKRAVDNLSGKTVNVRADGNIITGAAKTAIENVKGVIDRLRDKTVNVTTNQKTVVSGPTATTRAEGGIRKHARGDIVVANNPGPGVPLDIVGEAGPEAIVPLTSRYGKEFAQMMGREAGKFMGSGPSVSIYLSYDAGTDAKTMVMDIAHELDVLGLTGA